jgi:hypothetical protein
MNCWTASVVGAFFISILIWDVLQGFYGNLPLHSILGIIMTLLFWVICSGFGEEIAAAILVIPAIFFIFYVIIDYVNGELTVDTGSVENSTSCPKPEDDCPKPEDDCAKPKCDEPPKKC